MKSIVAWAWRNNDDEQFVITFDEPEICWEKRPLVFPLDEDQQAAFIQSAYEQGKADAFAQSEPQIWAHLHLIDVFANDTNERNFADKADYIKQQVGRIRSILDEIRGGQ